VHDVIGGQSGGIPCGGELGEVGEHVRADVRVDVCVEVRARRRVDCWRGCGPRFCNNGRRGGVQVVRLGRIEYRGSATMGGGGGGAGGAFRANRAPRFCNKGVGCRWCV
jgi:hypothetical protein